MMPAPAIQAQRKIKGKRLKSMPLKRLFWKSNPALLLTLLSTKLDHVDLAKMHRNLGRWVVLYEPDLFLNGYDKVIIVRKKEIMYFELAAKGMYHTATGCK